MIEPLDGLEDAVAKLAAGTSSVAATGGSRRRESTVLLATARKSLVAWFRVALATVGLTLVVSPDGLHALMTAVREPPELVILDDDLPGVDAERVEHLLARDARTAKARIVHVKLPPDDSEERGAYVESAPIEYQTANRA